MSTTLVIVLRAASIMVVAAPLLLADGHRSPKARTVQGLGERMPVLANFSAFALFLSFLLLFAGRVQGGWALLLASIGFLLAVAGAALVLRSRMDLGPAWSFVPAADETRGLVTAGVYRHVRHPIYLGLSTIALGQALAFASWSALLVVLAGVVPTFVWRALAEEKVLHAAFGERYALYRRQTRTIVPRRPRSICERPTMRG